MKRKSSSGGKGGGAASKRRKGNDAGAAAAAINEKLYTQHDAILVLGDGDFTFSRGLVTHRGGGRNLTATSFDSESKVKAKYSNARECISAVRAAGATVLHGVDATKLQALPRQHGNDGNASNVPPFFKYIIFNFPHTGQQRVHINRALLLDFFESARPKLEKTGEVHITLKNRPPYSNWNVEDQAKAAGFALKARRKFNERSFPGYHHRTTDPQAKKFEAELCTTYVFIVNRSKFPFGPIEAAQRELEERGSDVEEPMDGESHESAADSGDEEEEGQDKQEHMAPRVELATKSKTTKRKRAKRHGSTTVTPIAAVETATPTPTPTQSQPVARRATLWRPLHRNRAI